jgi:hypothetical protein
MASFAASDETAFDAEGAKRSAEGAEKILRSDD